MLIPMLSAFLKTPDVCRRGMAAYDAGDYAQAMAWLRPAARRGQVDAQFKVGVMFDNGWGVGKNDEAAVAWYHGAAAQGHAKALFNLGVKLSGGEGVSTSTDQAAHFFRAAADLGDDHLQFKLAEMYAAGRVVDQNHDEAARLFRLLAERGNQDAHARLIEMYSNNLVDDPREAEAVRTDTLAAEQGDMSAQLVLGYKYYSGSGVRQNYQKAAQYYCLAARLVESVAKGLLNAMRINGAPSAPEECRTAVIFYCVAIKKTASFPIQGKLDREHWGWSQKSVEADAQHILQLMFMMLGDMHADGEGVSQDHEEAARWYREAAELGASEAQFKLGALYADRRATLPRLHPRHSVSKFDLDRETARLLRLAIAQGNLSAQLKLAAMYLEHRLFDRDDKEEESCLLVASEHGNPEAAYRLGHLYEFGRPLTGLGEDFSKAVRYYRRAAEHGDPDAQASLGRIYANGVSIPRNDVEAVRLLRLAAERGHADGQRRLGEIYARGGGVAQDLAEAIRWYRLAAEQGDADAQLFLGEMYAKGEGIPENLVEAYKWVNLAASALEYVDDHTPEVQARASLERRMTTEQIAEAQRLSFEWEPVGSRQV